jgi:hypothetical protein
MRSVKHFWEVSIVIIIGTVFSAAFSEEWATDRGSAYVKGSRTVDIGLAVIPTGFYGVYEWGIHEAISAGVAAGIMGDPYFYFPLIGRLDFHPFNLTALASKITIRDKFDVYAGLVLGFQFGEDAPSLIIIRENIGIKYYFTPKFGIFFEDCGGLGFFNIGVCIKM